MNLFSASEDLAIRTLKHLPGALARLLYLVTLRDKDGNYRHWGMAQVFGDEASMQAAREAHKEAFNEILRTPLQKLGLSLRIQEEVMRLFRRFNCANLRWQGGN